MSMNIETHPADRKPDSRRSSGLAHLGPFLDVSVSQSAALNRGYSTTTFGNNDPDAPINNVPFGVNRNDPNRPILFPQNGGNIYDPSQYFLQSFDFDNKSQSY
jgi:hypothetical protein